MTMFLPLWRHARMCAFLCPLLLALATMPLLAFASSSGTLAPTSGPVLDAGEYHNCGVQETGELTCWGDNASGQGTFPFQTRFIAVATGVDHTCGLRANGQAICWGAPGSIATAPPTGPFIALSAGNAETCGLRSNGELRCWGGGLAETVPTTGIFVALNIANGRGCAIRSDGGLQCWQAAGIASLGVPPSGRFLDLSLGSSHACALRSDGKILCWGSNTQGQTAAPSADTFIAVASGHQHSCGVRENGNLVCWGANPSGQLSVPAGRYTAIAAGRLHTCARDDEAALRCWGGSNSRNERTAPAYDFQKLAVGRDQACGLTYPGDIACSGAANALTPPVRRYNEVSFGEQTVCVLAVDSRPQCWGDIADMPPNEPLTSISVGVAHVCGVRVDGSAVCWGDNSFGQSTPTPGQYSKVVSGDRFTCALGTDSDLFCWGQGPVVDGAPQGGFAQLSAYGRNACVVEHSGDVQCWGTDAAVIAPPSGQFGYIAVGERHVCGIRQSAVDVLQCWGDNSQGQLQSPSGLGFYRIAAFGDTTCATEVTKMQCWGAQTITRDGRSPRLAPAAIAAGDAHTCTVRGNRGVGCWGDNAFGQRNAAIHRAQSISANADHTCSLQVGGEARCWGDNTHNGSTPPSVSLRMLDMGQFNGCGVGANGAANCWGWNVNAQSTPPVALFRSVATGLNHSCGVRDDGTLACWGYNADGQTTAPTGVFKAVDVGERHSCAIAEAGSVTCWGLNSEGQTTPPELGAATYRSLASGAFHNCAILSNGGIACWGRNANGQATPPEEGQYVSIAAGTAHTCAVRDDGGRVCWGANESGQAPQIAVGPAVFPALTNGEPTSIDLQMLVTGSYTPVSPTFGFVEGHLPFGLEINAYGQILGIPGDEPGTHTFTIRASDENGFQATREFSVVLNEAPDVTPPSIVPTYNGFAFYTEWYNTNVELVWTVTDQESSVSTSGCETVTVTTDTDGTSFTCTATSEGGTSTQTVVIRRDATPPDTQLDQTPPALSWGGGAQYSETFAFSMVGTDASGFARFECMVFGIGSFSCNSPQAVGGLNFGTTYTIQVRAKDLAGNIDPTPATYTWVKYRDTTPPLLTPTYAGTMGDNGWYISDAHLTWTIDDPESAIVSTTGCDALHVTADTAGINRVCTVRSAGGETWRVGSIKRDATAPTVVASTTAVPNAAGWHRQNVTVLYTCVETTSGLPTFCPSAETISQEGHNVSTTAKTVRDFAGNTATSNVITINLDKTAPQVISERRTLPNATGWYRDDVTIDFICTDTVSGLAAPCPPPYTYTGEGRELTYQVPVNDIAGNQTLAGWLLSIDRTAPTISASATTAPNAAGWYRTNVGVAFACNDALSGINVCPFAQTLSQEGEAVSSTAQTAVDYASNVSAPSNVVTVKIDKTAPTLNVTMPPATVLLNATHDFQLNASDALSGVATQSCSGFVTGSLGTRSVTCTATDRAGNSVSRSSTYRVVYGYAALSAPLIDPSQVYVVQAPRSVPLEWRLFDANGAAITNATLTQSTVTDIACPSTGVGLTTAPSGETNSFAHSGRWHVSTELVDQLHRDGLFAFGHHAQRRYAAQRDDPRGAEGDAHGRELPIDTPAGAQQQCGAGTGAADADAGDTTECAEKSAASRFTETEAIVNQDRRYRVLCVVEPFAACVAIALF